MPTFIGAAATLPAKDLESARRFYEGTLGLTVEEENPGGVLYRAGSSQLFLYASQFAGTNQATAATFQVPDIEATISELREAGVMLEEYDLPGVKTENGITEFDGDRGAWVKDPEGNILALVQRGAT